MIYPTKRIFAGIVVIVLESLQVQFKGGVFKECERGVKFA